MYAGQYIVFHTESFYKTLANGVDTLHFFGSMHSPDSQSCPACA